jgi:hypothetical protein
MLHGYTRIFQVFDMYVSSVSSRCYKSRSECCIYIHVAIICFKCFIHILQVFYLDVAYVLQWLHMCFQVFLGVCMCFRSMYVSSISSKCYKSGSGVAHITMGPMYRSAYCSCWSVTVGDCAGALGQQTHIWHASTSGTVLQYSSREAKAGGIIGEAEVLPNRP